MDLIWEQVVVDAHDPGALGRWWAEALGWVVVADAADEFEIRPTPDRVPGLLFVPVPEERAGKNTSVRSIKLRRIVFGRGEVEDAFYSCDNDGCATEDYCADTTS